jgi:hypothetical protein
LLISAGEIIERRRKLMIPIHYRDSETEEELGRGFEEVLPAVGQAVFVDDIGECRVVYRWQNGPGASVAYVRRILPENNYSA